MTDKRHSATLMKNDKVQFTFGNAEVYERFVGRWSRLVAPQFLNWLNVPKELGWLDVGTGTGVLSQAILDQVLPTKLIGIDASSEYVHLARERIKDNRVEFQVSDATNLEFEQRFDVAVAGLVINFIPEPEKMLLSMQQAVKSGGLIGIYVWDYSGKMEMMRYFWDAAISLDPVASEMDSGKRFTICRPEALRTLFQEVGMEEVEVTALDVECHFQDFDDYWLPFLGAQGSVSRYIQSLNETQRTALRAQLLNQLPINNDGTIDLIARVWAVKGITLR